MPYVAMPTNALVAPCKASPTCFMTPVLVPPVITQAPGVFATFGKFEYVLQWNFSKFFKYRKNFCPFVRDVHFYDMILFSTF